MRQIKATKIIKIPKGVTVTVKARRVRVKGPRGVLEKDFRKINVTLEVVKGGKELKAELWFGDRKTTATVRTVTSHIKNMITGVTKGFQYKMRMVYAHFPIGVTVEGDGRDIAIRNFLGEKQVRTVRVSQGVTVERSKDVKDEILLHGNDVDAISQSAANIHCSIRVCDKDIRKFLDGVYVSHSRDQH